MTVRPRTRRQHPAVARSRADHRSRVAALRRQRMRRRLLLAAMVVLPRKGLSATVIDDVADEAGVSHGTVYRYFDSIDALLSAVGQDLAKETILRFEEAVAGFADPAERVAGGMTLFLRAAEAYPTFARFRVSVGLQIVHPRDAAGMALPEHLAAGIRTGRFPRTSVPAAMDMVLGAALMATSRIARSGPEPRHRERVVAVTLMGLGLDRDEAVRLSRRSYRMPPQAPDSLLALSDERVRALRRRRRS